MKKIDLVLGGVGGQGILTIAGVIAQTALRAGLNVKQSEVHGMAQRGGAVEAHLRLSPETVWSDLVPTGTAAVVCGMEPMEALRQRHYLAPGGCLVASTDPIPSGADYPPVADLIAELRKTPDAVLLPAAEMARIAGNARAANMVLLGAVAARLKLPEATVRAVIADLFKSKGDDVVEANLKAFAAGQDAASY